MRRRLFAALGSAIILACASGVLAQVSDDFDGLELDTESWTFVDPLGDSSYSISDGALTLSVAGGQEHDLWRSGNNSVRVMQPVANIDFEIEARYLSIPAQAFQIQGLLVEQSPGNYLRFDYYHDGANLRVFGATFVNDFPTVRVNTVVPAVGTLHLRLRREGNSWQGFISSDGQDWVQAVQFNHMLTASQVGVYGGNAGNPAPAFDARIDYFYENSGTLPPDDLDPPVISNVQVDAGIDSAVISWSTDEPAVGRVAYGLTPSLELGVIAPPGYVVAHSAVLPGLSAEASHYFQIESEDASGNIAWTEILDFVTSPAPVDQPSFVSDHFNGTALNTDLWTFIDPLGDGGHSVGDGYLTLSVAGGLAHDLWRSGNNSVRVMQPVENEDFEIEARFASVPQQVSQIQGVIVEQSPGNYIRLDYFHDGATLRVFSASFMSNLPTVRTNTAVASSDELFLRLRREGNTWHGYYSPDGETWTQATQFNLVLTANQVGVYGGNAGNPAPAFDVLVDYVFDTSAPALPDDDTTPPVIADIQVEAEATLAQVSLTTDEATLVRLAYGLTAELELGLIEGAEYATAHALVLGGLTAETEYFFQIEAEDAAGNTAQTEIATFATLAEPADTTPPVIANVLVEAEATLAQVSLTTDEPALVRLAYGLTAELELGLIEGAEYATAHALVLGGLTAETGYFFQIEAEDAAGNTAQTEIATFATLAEPNLPPVVALTEPAPGAQFLAGDIVALAADASDPDGEIERVEFIVEGQVVAFATDAPYAAIWEATLVGDISVQARSFDDEGLSAESDPVTIVVIQESWGSVLVSDEFNSSELNTAVWTFIDPVGDGSHAMGGGLLTLAVNGGTAHDLWSSGNNSVRIVQPSPDVDLDVEVRFASAPAQAFQIQGLLIEQGPGHYIRFDYYHDGSALRIFGASFVNNTPTVRVNSIVPSGQALYLRLQRESNIWRGLRSADGQNWVQAMQFNHPLVVDKVGIYGGNAGPSGAPAPAFDVLVDYFRDLTAPLPPDEDPPVIGDIATTVSFDEAVVSWTTDELAFGRVHYGLTMALEIGHVAGDGYQMSHAIGLPMLAPETVYFFQIESEDGSGNVALSDIYDLTTLPQPNSLPEVALLDPFDGAVFLLDTLVPLAAAASDPDGEVVRVEFVVDGQIVATVTEPPYEAFWQADATGNISVLARAVDNEGGVGESLPVAIWISAQGERVYSDLQAFYLFQEGEGAIVRDRSGVAPSLDLTIANPGVVSWLPDGGLQLAQPTMLSSIQAATKISVASRNSGEVTIEAWVQPLHVDQSGPARIVSMSGDPNNRNFTLGHGLWGTQPTTVYDFRVRSTTTNLNGQPATTTPAGTITGELQHVVYTRATNGQARIFVDGLEITTGTVGGNLGNWNDTYPLLVGAEVTGDRNWLGTLHLVAIYSRSLSEAEIAQNFAAGPSGGELMPIMPVVTLDVPNAATPFPFDETIVLDAYASDPDGSVVQVDFLSGGQAITSLTEAPFTVHWSNPPPGNHLIQAVAVDDDGQTGLSGGVPVQVFLPPQYLDSQMVSDGFTGPSFSGVWEVTDSTGQANVVQNGGLVSVTVPGTNQDLFAPDAAAFYASQPESDVATALQITLAADSFVGSVAAGLRFEGDSGAAVQYLAHRDGDGWQLTWGALDGDGAVVQTGALPLAAIGERLHLQLRRVGAVWTLLHSSNGLLWHGAAELTQPLTLVRSGWLVGGFAAGGPVTAVVDSMVNLADPLTPAGEGDVTGPVIGAVAVSATFSTARLEFTTDEPAAVRVHYGLTSAYESGEVAYDGYQQQHVVDLAGLQEAQIYHYRITAIDAAGNFTISNDQIFGTNILAVPSGGPVAGDVYREVQHTMAANQWRVTDPNAGNAGAQQYLPNPVLTVNVPDLTGAVRAELIVDRWGGHPGTSNKRIRFNSLSWLRLPELETTPSGNPECYMYQDNLMIDIPLAQLQTGVNTLEGTSAGQLCNNFNWGQWGWYGLLLRIYYEGDIPHPEGEIISPVAGSYLGENVPIEVAASAIGEVAEVIVLGRYHGFDVDGDGYFYDWHRHYHLPHNANQLVMANIIGSTATAPYQLTWNTRWLPDQEPGAVALQARIRDDAGWWYVTEGVDNLSLERTTEEVKLFTTPNLPPVFWVRNGQSRTAEFTIPESDDLGRAIEAQLVVRTWNGRDGGVMELNGLWTRTSFGVYDHYEMSTIGLPLEALLNGVNQLTFSSNTIHHGVEVLWPGPMVAVRYMRVAPAPVITPPGGVREDTVLVAIDGEPGSEIRYTVDGSQPTSSSPLYSGPFSLTSSATVRAIAFQPDVLPSQIANASFVVTEPSEGRVVNDLQALYVFSEGTGSMVHDVTGLVPALNLSMDDPGAVTWLSGSGLRLDTPTRLSTQGAASRLNQALRTTGAFTAEVWITPATASQGGPARIVSLSSTPFERNLTLAHGRSNGQSGTVYDLRARTSNNGLNGLPSLNTPTGTASTELQHVVATGDANGSVRIYVDGVQVAAGTRTGDLSNWDAAFPLLLGAEADGTRTWLGSYHLVAFYSRALAAAEVAKNFQAGPLGSSLQPQPPTVAILQPTPLALLPADEMTPIQVQAVDVDGDVTHVELFADGVLLFETGEGMLTAEWSPPVGTYQLVARATDSGGRQALSEPVTVAAFTGGPNQEPAAFSSDFRGDLIDPAVWQFDDPRDHCSYWVEDGRLHIDVPGGIRHDIWTDGVTAPRLLQPLANRDADLLLKIDSVPQQAFQLNGLLFEGAPSHWLRVEVHHNGSSPRFFVASYDGSAVTTHANLALPVSDHYWLRVLRTSNLWRVDVSVDGETWSTHLADLALPFTVETVGLHAGNAGANPPPYTARFDYFFDSRAPVTSEDSDVIDFLPPVITNVLVVTDPNAGTAQITCTTNEDATTLLEYGLDSTYGIQISGAGVGREHEFNLSGLLNDVVYHFRISATDLAGNLASIDDRNFSLVQQTGPAVVVWHGLQQRVGHLGDSQADFNVMGNISPIGDIASFTYRVNGGLPVALSWGSHISGFGDRRRLAATGDFNADIPITQLNFGANQVQLRAVGLDGGETVVNVIVNRETGSYPLPVSIDWSTTSEPQDVGQYVDGHWQHAGSGLRTEEVGYDRVFLIGEVDWQDYDVVVPVTLHEVHPSGPLSGGQGLGLIMRFTGHIVGGHRNWPEAQPKFGYQPFGGIGWLRWAQGMDNPPVMQFYHGDYDVVNNFGMPPAKAAALADALAKPDKLPFGDPVLTKDFGEKNIEPDMIYWMRMRCETLPDAVDGRGVTRYSWRIWSDGQAEPGGWNWQVTQTSEHALRAGGLALLAHHVDATFGDVTITPLDQGAVLAGDVDGDGEVTLADAELVLQHLIGATELEVHQISAGNITGGALNAHDAALVTRLAAGHEVAVGKRPAAERELPRLDWAEPLGSYGDLEVTLSTRDDDLSIGSLWLELEAPGLATAVRTVTSTLADRGLLIWRGDGDVIRLAFAAAEDAPLDQRVVTIALNTSDFAAGTSLRAMLAVDGQPEVRLAALALEPVPTSYALANNFPNPFNPATTIAFELPETAGVQLRIFDVKGRLVRALVAERLAFGRHTIIWDGTDDSGRQVASGVYMYRLEAGHYADTRKMMLVR